MTDHGLRLRFVEADPTSVRFVCTCGGWDLPVPRTDPSVCEVTPKMREDAHLLWATRHVAPVPAREPAPIGDLLPGVVEVLAETTATQRAQDRRNDEEIPMCPCPGCGKPIFDWQKCCDACAKGKS